MPPVVLGKRQRRDSVGSMCLQRFHRDEIRHLQLVGNAEQHAVMMFFDPCRAKRGPGGVLRGDLELPLVFLLGIQPPGDVFHEARFG